MKNKMDNYDEGDEVEVSSIPLPSFSSPPPPHDDEEGHKPDDVYFSPDTFDWGWGEDDNKDLVPSNQRGALCPGKFEQPPTIRRKCPPPSSFYYAYAHPLPPPPPALHETHLDSIACNTCSIVGGDRHSFGRPRLSSGGTTYEPSFGFEVGFEL